jgi:serine/threonine-protein phosphatase 2A regulatory subunit B''
LFSSTSSLQSSLLSTSSSSSSQPGSRNRLTSTSSDSVSDQSCGEEFNTINNLINDDHLTISISSNAPPRSPTKKSPKKRSQSEMSPGGNVVGGILSSPTALVLNLSDSTTNQSNNQTKNQGVLAEESQLVNNNNSPEVEKTNARRRSNFDTIPKFYISGVGNKSRARASRYRIEEDQLTNRLSEIESFFKPFPNGIPLEKFVHVTKRLCGIPSFFNLPMCKRLNDFYGDNISGNNKVGLKNDNRAIDNRTIGKVKLKAFLSFWQAEIEPYDRIERFFRIIKQPENDYICKDDFVPLIQELLHFHPGLFFLENQEEFQRKYALTVITRIFYSVNTSRSGKISLREVRNSNLMSEFMHVDEETDINRVVEYFSYEHFYVLYCKFFELDIDKDGKIHREDLLKYAEHSLSELVVDRVFQVGNRVFSDGKIGSFKQTGMSFPDFIFFMLSEEDKTSERSLRYWFSCCDLDGDDCLSAEELRHFYKLQLHRITSMGQEVIQFEDVLCQMIDMIDPVDPHSIVITDLIKPDKRNISGTLFDVLFNLHKFMRFETRDPFHEKQKKDDPYDCDWDRYAQSEYHRLAQEEEGYDGNMEVDRDAESRYVSNLEGQEDINDWSLDEEDIENSYGK